LSYLAFQLEIAARLYCIEWKRCRGLSTALLSEARALPLEGMMPGTTATHDTEIVVIEIGGGGGGVAPPAGGGGGGGGDKGGGSSRKPPQGRYSTAIKLGMISIFMFFLVPCTVFIVLEHTSEAWVPLHLPKILWLNTAILLTSSYTLEIAGRKLLNADFPGFRILWRATTVLGILFLAGQVVAWLQLVASGLYIASNQATSFFYIFTAAHAVHLLGGIAALLYVAMRDFEKGKISRQTAVKITSYYWHFMDGLWVFLLLLLYFGR
jgi:cytochrome c oxidase subunit 3